jgi:AcrR family transcriptional regulator
VRACDIVVKARVNQAAINYHFKGKDELYLEVLKTAFEKLTEHAGSDPEKLKSLSRLLRVPEQYR